MDDKGTTLAVWGKEQRDIVRKTFAPDLTQTEFAMFVGLGKSLGANPFTREIWAVKYGNNSAQIFLGRDFYRRKAQEQPEYKGHQVDAIYSNDTFKMVGGKPEHSYSLQDRGELIGAYCVVFRADNEPYFNTVKFSEYTTGKALWNSKPETMIKKVAEAQALRGAFQGIFAGTYDDSEQWIDESDVDRLPKNNDTLPEAVRHLQGRYPFDKTLKCPRNDHRPYLSDGSEELDKVEQDIVNGTLEPRYVRYFYTCTNTMWDYLQEIPERIVEGDNLFDKIERQSQ